MLLKDIYILLDLVQLVNMWLQSTISSLINLYFLIHLNLLLLKSCNRNISCMPNKLIILIVSSRCRNGCLTTNRSILIGWYKSLIGFQHFCIAVLATKGVVYLLHYRSGLSIGFSFQSLICNRVLP